ncbi:hypothetical protein M440DRAFT_1394328 [Trichoderma longibrachiatum ATCC 18648]|uniref:Uncharacterized protein n=1 Tax=Trichoderma longibrachiatum ATCC 18648 TaxID=983965 RepID=A0A2T4BUY5_TRILO|nr:hypothetical protein M440DRAFT_1394328 [Trichoderma longibrachiatum ATCC 18648]
MAKYCNRWAKAAGHEEPHAEQAMTYFFAAYHCDRLARVKRERPTATREEVLWHNLDCWGLPTVPWARHPFKKSLAKVLDDGTLNMYRKMLQPVERHPLLHQLWNNANSSLRLQIMNAVKVVSLDKLDPVQHIDTRQ